MHLYVHVPFCLRKCLYCDFNSVAGWPVTSAEYAAAVVREMDLRAQLAGGGRPPAPTLYFGGGTPSLLGPEEVGAVIDAAHAAYGLASGAEITLEANPGTVTAESLRAYRAAGVNRLSLGIQSFNDANLERLGRLHTARGAVEAYEAARGAGFDNIGIDLMHSLPGQTPEEWLDDLDAGVGLAPDHISAYGLTIEEGTPFHRLRDTGELQPADEETALTMFRDTGAFLTDRGYEHYEISNFALPGRRSRHNQAYWLRREYAGFGAGAHSFSLTPKWGARWHNELDIAEYSRAIGNGIVPERDRSALERRDAMAEFLFLGLRMLEGVREEEFAAAFGVPIDDVYGEEVTRLVKARLLVREKGWLRISEKGLPLHNQVVLHFL